MRFSFAEAMIDSTFYRPLAEAADAAGYDSMAVPDGLLYARTADSDYPYTQEGSREFLEDKPFIEPFVLISAMGAHTSRISFDINVLKLPVRAPVLVAKQATSVAVLTGNRIRLGVGLSPWREDYESLGVPWQGRGQRMDESIDILRGLITGTFFSYRGQVFDVPEIKLSPVPTAPVPILVGGHSDAALRRAAVRGDGWMHAGGRGEDLDGLLGKLAAIRRAEGVADRPFEIQVGAPDAYTVDGDRRLAEQGVTQVRVASATPTRRGRTPSRCSASWTSCTGTPTR